MGAIEKVKELPWICDGVHTPTVKRAIAILENAESLEEAVGEIKGLLWTSAYVHEPTLKLIVAVLQDE